MADETTGATKEQRLKKIMDELMETLEESEKLSKEMFSANIGQGTPQQIRAWKEGTKRTNTRTRALRKELRDLKGEK